MAGIDREKVEKQRQALVDMLKSDGWQIYKAWVMGQMETALAHITDPKTTGDETLRAAGSMAQLQELTRWPKRQMETFTKQLSKEEEIKS